MMELTLSSLKSPKRRKNKKRLGRGDASGHGTYSGRGQKGQKARSGGKGGLKLKAMRKIWKKIPKRGGFRSLKEKITIINLDQIEKNFSLGEIVSPQTLFEKGLIKDPKEKIKILGKGRLTKKLIFKIHAFSKTAENAIKKVGGFLQILESKR